MLDFSGYKPVDHLLDALIRAITAYALVIVGSETWAICTGGPESFTLPAWGLITGLGVATIFSKIMD